MKNTKLIFAAALLLTVANTGCSLFSHKVEAKPSNEIIDAGYVSTEPVKVKETHTIDAGIYREKEDYSDLALHGGKNGAVIPVEKFYAIDREKHAPVGRVLYFLTDATPAHCIMGKYVNLDGRKKLVVFSKSTVPTNYCIYQKQFSTEAEGFSLYVSDGGRCKPSFTSIKVDDQKRKLASVEEIGNTVSMSYCVDNTFSYGQELARHAK
jgi:hypothetical protein